MAATRCQGQTEIKNQLDGLSENKLAKVVWLVGQTTPIKLAATDHSSFEWQPIVRRHSNAREYNTC